MYLKTGMTVRIVNEFDYDDPIGINYEMERLRGKVATIISVGENEYGRFARIDLDEGEWAWTKTMIVPLAMNKGKGLEDTNKEKDLENRGKRLVFPRSYLAVPVGDCGSMFAE